MECNNGGVLFFAGFAIALPIQLVKSKREKIGKMNRIHVNKSESSINFKEREIRISLVFSLCLDVWSFFLSFLLHIYKKVNTCICFVVN